MAIGENGPFLTNRNAEMKQSGEAFCRVILSSICQLALDPVVPKTGEWIHRLKCVFEER